MRASGRFPRPWPALPMATQDERHDLPRELRHLHTHGGVSPSRCIDPHHLDALDVSSQPDIFRDTPARYLGFSNEVTTATRSIPAVIKALPMWNSLGWAVALSYGMMDAWNKSMDSQRKYLERGEPSDVALRWHTLHSVGPTLVALFVPAAAAPAARAPEIERRIGEAQRYVDLYAELAEQPPTRRACPTVPKPRRKSLRWPAITRPSIRRRFPARPATEPISSVAGVSPSGPGSRVSWCRRSVWSGGFSAGD